ncbi:hypothetical protein DF021_34600 [Burkholderia stagnalis]|uniref:Uncharacterized protein n=1 Tax=Burkholderia stagnalis TaxID=1503054 RepID=A0ABX9YF42_9BURK|nr:hypothetical protein DF158_34665 [Burkholderia stagnalis]RQQ58593.1 hypothetical protein DF139_35080 [Burkholderia stagnalis]RQQ58610.1 hypothetical protein DF137_35010 [Burkholderia stagnalis]RQQ72521.1 hypothetical protein DF138_34845 [Burkholderia stagnalis]RQQ78881.1 hypothetical protein DF134_35230 [Burkholderia stagnalis]
MEYRSTRSGRGYAAKVPCAPGTLRYASKGGGSGRQIHALNPARKDGAQTRQSPGSPATRRGAARGAASLARREPGAGTRPTGRASGARSAGTARRRQGLKPVRGETRAARLDAQRESPARSEAQGDAQPGEGERSPSGKTQR